MPSKYNFWVPEMAHDVIETDDFLWSARIINTIVCLLVTLLLIDHIYNVFFVKSVQVSESSEKSPRTRTHSRSTESQQRGSINPTWFKARTFVTTFFIASSFATSTIQCLNIWSAFDINLDDCQTLMYIYCVFYHCTKLSLYCIFIITSYIVFNNSAFKYSQGFIKICLIIVTIFGIVILIGTYFNVEGALLTKPVTWCHVHIKPGATVQIEMGIWIFGSAFLYLASVLLFIRPLLSLIGLLDVSTQQGVKRARNSRVNHLIIKISLLNGIAIVSSLASLLVYLFSHISIVIDIDIFITAACVLIATSRHHEELYQKLCKPCHWLGDRHRHRSIQKQAEKSVVTNNESQHDDIEMPETEATAEAGHAPHNQHNLVSDTNDD